MIHILSRRTKNNPVILGEPGVGKVSLQHVLDCRIRLLCALLGKVGLQRLIVLWYTWKFWLHTRSHQNSALVFTAVCDSRF